MSSSHNKPSEYDVGPHGYPIAPPVGKLEKENKPRMGIFIDHVRKKTHWLFKKYPKKVDPPYAVTEEDLDYDEVREKDLVKEPQPFVEREPLLPYEHYRELFPKGALPEQVASGNCWVVAALIALAHHPSFTKLMRTSIRPVWRNGEVVAWDVRVPLGGRGDEFVGVKRSELGKKSVGGALGFRILEAVIANMEVQEDQRKGIRLHSPNGKLNIEEVLKSGSAERALSHLLEDCCLPRKIAAKSVSFLNASQEIRDTALRYLDQFSPEYDICTMSTQRTPTGQKEEFHIASSSFEFLHGHAYSVVDVDRRARTVTLVDPNDPSESVEISWRDALSNFSKISGVELAGKQLRQDAAKRA